MIAATLFASAAIILLSFVSEDAAAVSSALSIFGGPFSWRVGFVSCFAGIWLGDLGLYSLARCAGKNLLHTRWVRRFADPCAIPGCEKVFSRHSSVALITSRFVPGTRLPTYLAAGLFGMPLRRFALITAVAGLVWVSGVFAVTKIFGTHVLLWFTSGQTKIAAVVLTGLVISTAILLLRKARFRTIAHQLGQWEFWPAWIFYIPVVVYYLFLAIRYRSFTLPTAANPGMQNGGFIGESKQEILKLLQEADAEFIADAYLLEGCTTSDRLLALHRLCRNHRIAPPFILKPDFGQRGNGVRLVRSLREALDYLLEVDAPVILQRYAPGPSEVGVFYFGRFDIRYDDEGDLRAGRDFKIVELNGASSEATNIYDARNSLRSAYRTLFRQWRLVFEIGAANRKRGWTPSPLRTLWRAWRGYCAAAATYPCAS